jgi:hypothetical protein
MMMSFNNRNKLSVLTMICFGLLTLQSCVKEAPIDAYPPEQAVGCFDGIRNQGEYNIDCGGPCAPCKVGNPFITVTVDSTWVNDTNKTDNRFWTPLDVYVNDSVIMDSLLISPNPDYVIIHAVEIMGRNPDQFIRLTFKIPKSLAEGVYEIKEMDYYEAYESFPPGINSGTFKLLHGVITITNRDDFNGYISGRFEFNSEPENFTKVRIALIDGEFRDIPLYQ